MWLLNSAPDDSIRITLTYLRSNLASLMRGEENIVLVAIPLTEVRGYLY